MTNSIVQGIIDALAEAFPDVTLYAEKVPQNFEEPSFRVKRLLVNNRSELGTMRRRTVTFDVLYFPGSEDEPESEWNTVADALFIALEYITAGDDLLRADDMSAEFDAEQSVGHFRMTYGLHLLDVPEEVEVMETIERMETIKQPHQREME